tara:strand:+ start:42 stop:323 length:282 start_codon:yes stop_codon:yes gene_type:complete
MIERKDIEHLAHLSRLSFTEEEIAGFGEDINAILAYVDQLKEVATSEEEPAVGVVHNVMREDVEAFDGGEHRDEIVESFPEREGDYLKVKKIL